MYIVKLKKKKVKFQPKELNFIKRWLTVGVVLNSLRSFDALIFTGTLSHNFTANWMSCVFQCLC